ncbi:MAG: single-stranded DNA-binding protein [Terrimicrobiaceae bacterium]|jgi:hypothetical protein
MAVDFSQLKKSRQNQFDQLTSELTKLNTQQTANSSDDNRFWKAEVDKAGNGYAVIRFLPAPTGEDVPFVRVWDHGFQGPGGWYIEKSLTTLGQKDPVSEYNTQLWNSGVEANKEIVRKQKRRLSFVSNIYVVKDPAHPENEGKVFLYKYGKKIFDKLNETMNPQFEDEKPVNPFDLWEGANFKLKIRNVEGYRNYDKSEFESPSPLLDDDEKLEKIWHSEHKLQPFLDPSNFKSYDELKDKLNRVLGLTGTVKPQTRAEDSPPWEEEAAPVIKSKPAPVMEEDDDESMDFFKKLAEED